jgi:hypothetical protein
MTTLTPKEVSKLVTDALTIAMCSSGNLKVTPYDGDISYRALEFLEDFEDSAKSKGWTDQNKFERFGGYLILSAKDWFKLCVTKNFSPPTDWKSLKQAFIEHHLPKDRDRYYREQLSKRKQASKEPVSQYIVSKHLLCLEVNPKMTETEVMLYIFEDMLPEIKKELHIKDYQNLQELKDNAERIESAIRIISNQGYPYESTTENDKSIRALVEGFNLLLSRVEDNSVQLQNLNKNRNERNDKFQNRFPPRYSNNVRPNFRNDFSLQYNTNQGNNRNYNPNSYQSNGFNQNIRSNNFRNHPNNYATHQYFYSNNRDTNKTNVKSYYNQKNNRRVSFDTPQQIRNSESFGRSKMPWVWENRSLCKILSKHTTTSKCFQ